MIFTCCFLQCKPCNSSMVFDRTGRKFIVQEKNYNLQQQQKKPPKIQQPQIATITKKQQQQITKTKIENHKKLQQKYNNRKNYKPLFTGIITRLASLVLSLSLSLLPCMDTRSWSRLELGVQVSVPRPFQVPSRLTHTFPSS